MLRTNLTILAALMLFAAPAAVHAQCSTGDSFIEEESSALFGLRWDGTRIGDGESITLDCRSKILTASFMIRTHTSGEQNGVPYLNQGDEISVDIVDLDYAVLATGTATLPHESDFGWVTVDFSSQDVVLDPGTYIVGAYTTLDKIGSIRFSLNDAHPGQRYTYWNGSWANPSAGNETVFQATWEENQVPNDAIAWGTVKALYR